MTSTSTIECPCCGKRYKLTADYLAQYGGGTTACAACGQAIRLPIPVATTTSADAAAATPTVLAYAAPARPGRTSSEVWRDGNLLRTEPVSVALVDLNSAWLEGFGDGYLAHFPSWAAAVEADARDRAAQLNALAGQVELTDGGARHAT